MPDTPEQGTTSPAQGSHTGTPPAPQTGPAPVPYDRFSEQNRALRETEVKLAEANQREAELKQQLDTAQKPPVSVEPALEGDDAWLNTGVERHTRPLADKVDEVAQGMKPMQEFIAAQAHRERLASADKQLDDYFKERQYLTPEAQTVMRDVYKNRVVAQGLDQYVTLGDVEHTAIGVVTQKVLTGRIDAAQGQSNSNMQTPQPGNVSTGPTIPSAPPEGDGPKDFWETVDRNKSDWQEKFLAEHADVNLSAGAAEGSVKEFENYD